MANNNKKYKVGKSKIQGDGAFAKNALNPGDYIGKVHTINKLYEDYDFTELGKKHNHSENPNVQNVLIGNERHLVAIKPIKKGEELFSDYRLQPDLEQPDQDFEKAKGGKKLTASKAQNGIEGTMGGLTDKGFNYNPAWGGAWKNGGWMDKYQDGGEKPKNPKGKDRGVYLGDDNRWHWRNYTYFPENTTAYKDEKWGWTKDFDEVVVEGAPRRKPEFNIEDYSIYDINGNFVGFDDLAFIEGTKLEDVRRLGDIAKQTGVPSNEEIRQRAEYKSKPKYYTIEQADPNEEWESEDRRAWGSPSRVKERTEETIDVLRKASAVGQYVPSPYVMIPSIVTNSAIGLQDAYDANKKGDVTGRNLNLAGAIPIPGLKIFNQLKKAPGLSARQKASVMRTGLSLLGLDLFGTASDLTDNFGVEKQQNGGMLQPPMAGAMQTVPMAQMGTSLPGATGMMYARTAGAAPSEGPYAKKTLPSAQDGMTFYQHGLDWKPRNISRDGSSVNRADEYPLQKLDDLLNFTNYNKPKAKSGGWLDKYK